LSRPVLTIIAGSNGCGKSTLTFSARDKFQQAPILDPDAIAKSIQDTLDPNTSDIEAGKRVLRLAEDLTGGLLPKISEDACLIRV
jgi:predicted ABC-type ATPase